MPYVHGVTLEALQKALRTLRENKPNDKSEIDRRYAIAITDMEKVLVPFHWYVILNTNPNDKQDGV